MKQVLVIDDKPEIRMIISETLEMYGFGAVTAGDGQEGVRLARDRRPDLVICDIQMPTMDGFATLNAMRAQPDTATIPFIFLSGANDKGDIRRGMEKGADDYLTKPFTPQELLAAVNTRLSRTADWEEHSERKLNELRGNLTLALPHELRTPLSGIRGLAALMMEEDNAMPREEMLKSARFIHDAAQRLHRLIENFLVFSQLELLANSGKSIEIPPGLEPVAVSDVVPAVAQRVAAQYQRETDLSLDVGIAGLRIPNENVTKIVEELVDNAFKFSQAGQPVIVATEESDERLSLLVLDHGRGLTADQIRRIGPHVQFDRDKFEQQGSGLGLFIAKRMTELLGGEFTLESKPGESTIARATFPMLRA